MNPYEPLPTPHIIDLPIITSDDTFDADAETFTNDPQLVSPDRPSTNPTVNP